MSVVRSARMIHGMKFAGKTVLITGASSGIGEALARSFAAEGADLVLAARREDRLKSLCAEIAASGRRAIAVAVDVTKDGDCERAVAEGVKAFGRVDVAVANAGFGVMGHFDNLAIDDYRRQMETNVFGVLRTAYAALAELKRNGGSLVVVGSVSGHVPTPDVSAYCMSKFAIRGFCESIHAEMAQDGVAVTLVSPGFVESEIRTLDNQGRQAAVKDPIPRWLQLPASTAAHQIVRATHRRCREIVVTGHGKLGVFFYRHFPWLLNIGLWLAVRFGALPSTKAR